MDEWDHWQYLKESIEDYLDKNQMIIFFKKGDEFFGSPEESRIIFAKLKNDDEDDPMEPGFRDEAKFLATNLLKSIGGDHAVNHMFGIKDIPDLKVCDREEIVHLLTKNKKDKK